MQAAPAVRSRRDDLDYEAAGAELLGRDLASLCRGPVRAFVANLLARETAGHGHRLLASQMTMRNEDDALSLLVALRRGFEFAAAEGPPGSARG